MPELYASVASCKLPIDDSFFSISLSNKTVNGVPENVYIGDSKRNALSLQYAKAYLRYVKPGNRAWACSAAPAYRVTGALPLDRMLHKA